LRCRQCGKEEYNRWPGLLLQPAHTLGFVQRNDLLRRAYRRMKAVFAPSRFLLDAHLRHGFAKANLVYQPYGLPPVKRLEKAAPQHPLRVGYFGRLAPEKGIDTLIAAAALGKGFEVIVYGQGSATYESELKHLAQDAPVRFAGSFTHEQLASTLAEIDVVAVPSRWRENLPLAALEAASHGVPLLVSTIGGLAETVELCNAWTAAPDRPKQWAKLLQTLAEDEKRWQALKNQIHYSHLIKEDLEKQID
jgi:glycosyltransferase involved in cell wall biosynthesis